MVPPHTSPVTLVLKYERMRSLRSCSAITTVHGYRSASAVSVPMQAPAEQMSPRVHAPPSSQPVPSGNVPSGVQLSSSSLHDSVVQLLPSSHASVPVPEQMPDVHVSAAPLQNSPSSHADPSRSAALQRSVDSLQLSRQLASPSGPAHGSPLCTAHAPARQVSAPLQ